MGAKVERAFEVSSVRGGDEYASSSSSRFWSSSWPDAAKGSQGAAVASGIPDVVMRCRDPYIDMAGRAFACGQCPPCRHSKRMIWAHRIMLEAGQNVDNAFVTLTYSDAYLTCGEGGYATLVRKDLQDWLKRLRRKVEPARFRFFAVGEYGDRSWRPHYHVALFGYPCCEWGNSRYSNGVRNCCVACDMVRDTWGKGNVFLGTLENNSAGYISGYVTKKLTRADDTRLRGRVPEFARMSLKPGIGYNAMFDVADVMMLYRSSDADVPVCLDYGGRGKGRPLGAYLRRELRKMIGRDEKAPQAALDKIAAEMLPLRMVARLSEENPSFKQQVIKAGDASAARLEYRQRFFGGKGRSL